VCDQYRFVGWLMGIAVRTSAPLPLRLPILFWKLLMNAPITLRDLRSVDDAFASRHEYLLQLEEQGVTEDLFEDLDLEMFPPLSLRGSTRPITLTYQTRLEYVKTACHQRYGEWRSACEWIRKGMDEMVLRSLTQLFSPEEVRTLVTGSDVIDWNLLKSCAIYHSYTSSSPPVQWLWEILEGFSAEDSSQFLRFVWGRSRLPLHSAAFDQEFLIDKDSSNDRALPTSSTCFFTLHLPAYSSKEIMETKLRYAIAHCVSIDRDGETPDVPLEDDL